jgi:hypothetical protein
MTKSWHTECRMDAETYTVEAAGQLLYFTVGLDGAGRVVEIAINPPTGEGQTMQVLMLNLGIAISRAIQRRDPTTGGPIT